ncbi:MAG TPA: right-handed parallel beta-helix repeat-containing protein [Thermoanaerobaculia bacterium]
MVRPLATSDAAASDRWRPFGAETEGGLAGEIVRVTTLAASGPGSLRAALDVPRPRLIVFEVGGIIDLQGRTLTVRSPYVTIAGQTAPDPGITLIRGGLVVETHDAIVQHLAVRPGDRRHDPAKEWAPDALGVRRAEHGPVHDVVFEHCSATWAVDENLSTSGPADVDAGADPDITAHDVTIRNCLIAEALSNATHPKGEHSKGTLVHDGVRNVLITGSLYAHNRERNPRLKGGATALLAENVMYDWGSACVGMGAKGNDKVLAPAEAILVGNVAIAGADTRKNPVFVRGLDPGAKAYLQDNVAVSATGTPLPLQDESIVALPFAPVAAVDAWASYARVLRLAGSRPARRDPIDARIVQSVLDRTGRIIDSQEQVGGYPVRASTTRSLTVPQDVTARRAWLAKLAAEVTGE